MENIKVSAIAAMAKNRVIGKDNAIPWHIPEDFKFFKRVTMDKPMVMGRKTFESLPGMLKGRDHIVISRRGFSHPEAQGALSVREGLSLAEKIARKNKQDEIFIIGGAEIYKQTLPVTDRLYLTVIDRDYEGDTYFPEFKWEDWKVISEDRREGSPSFTFFVLERK